MICSSLDHYNGAKLNYYVINPKGSFDLIKRKYAVDLPGHIAQCEANYARIMRLLPDIGQADYREFGLHAVNGSGRRFSIKVLERCKYTTMLQVSELQVSELEADNSVAESSIAPNQADSEQAADWVSPPQFSLRVYHDAQMVEVIQYLRHRHIKPLYNYPNDQMHQSDEKAQWNIFLGEWLSHCLKHGYLLERFQVGETIHASDVNASIG